MTPGGRVRVSVPVAMGVAVALAGVFLVLQALWGGAPPESLPPSKPIAPLPVVRDPGRDITVALGPTADAGRAAPGALAGQVLGPDGRPFPDAEVEAEPTWFAAMPTGWVSVPQPQRARSGADGRFALQASLDWAWTVTARQGTLVAHEVGVLAPREDLVLRLVEGGRVHGTVKEADGRPVQGARVQLYPEGSGELLRELTTAADGAFSFERVPAGRWRVVAVELAPAEAPEKVQLARVRRQVSRDVELRAAGAAPVELVLPALGALRGRVTAPAGVGVAGLTVYAVEGRGAQELSRLGPASAAKLVGPHLANGTTGPDGRFQISGVAGELSLFLPHPTLLHDPVQARAEGPEVEVALRRPRVLAGRVVGKGGVPLLQFEVNGAAYASADGSFEHKLGLRGTTARPMPLVVRAPGHAPLQTALDVRGTGDVDAGTLVLAPGRAALVAKVVDDASGDPIEGLSFLRWSEAGALSEPAREISPGVYRFDGLPDGPVTIEARAFQGASNRYAVSGTEQDVLWRFARGVPVRGLVRQPDGRPAPGARVFLEGNVRSMTFTDAEGRFTLPGVAPGQVRLVVQRGTSHQLHPVLVPPSGEVELTVQLAE